jgi:hypothetical protein
VTSSFTEAQMSSDRLEMTIKLQVTEAQALAVQAMLQCWNSLASMGSSRYVSFYVDGDGNFKPKATWEYSKPVAELTNELREVAHAFVKTTRDENPGSHSDHAFDFDPIAWKLRNG